MTTKILTKIITKVKSRGNAHMHENKTTNITESCNIYISLSANYFATLNQFYFIVVLCCSRVSGRGRLVTQCYTAK